MDIEMLLVFFEDARVVKAQVFLESTLLTHVINGTCVFNSDEADLCLFFLFFLIFRCFDHFCLRLSFEFGDRL